MLRSIYLQLLVVMRACVCPPGMVIVAWPILTGSVQNESAMVSDRTQAYTTSKNLLISGADAVERIMTSFKEVRVGEPTCVSPWRVTVFPRLERTLK